MIYREHFLQFFYNIFTTIKDRVYALIPITFTIVNGLKTYKDWIYVSFIVLSLIIVFYSLNKWKRKTLRMTDTFLEVNEGLIQQKSDQIPIKNIQNIYTEDTFIKRIFGVAVMRIEVVGKSDIQFNLSLKKIEEIRQMLAIGEVNREVDKEKKNAFQFNLPDYLMVATSTRHILGTMALFCAAYTFIDRFISSKDKSGEKVEFKKLNEQTHFDFLGYEWVMQVWVQIILIAIGVLLLVYIICYPLTVIKLYIRYKNFHIQREEQKLMITFGFFKKWTYEVNIDKIRNLTFTQSYLQKNMGYGQMYIETAGSKKTSILLFPILKTNHVAEAVEKYVPEIHWDVSMEKPKKESFWIYLVPYFFKITMIIVIAAYLTGFHWLYIALYAYAIIGCAKWKYSGFYFDEERIKISVAGLTGVKTKWFKKNYIEHTETEQSFFCRNMGIATYSFSVFSERETEKYGIRGLALDKKENFLDYLNKKRK